MNPAKEGTITYKNLSLFVKSATSPFYFKIDEVSTISVLSLLPNNLGICYSIRAFGTSGEIFSPFLIIPEIQDVSYNKRIGKIGVVK
ncbi:MAG: hypothetical protein AB1595_06045 [bacterium]